MEKEKHNDEFICELIRRQEPERAPSGFTEAVMGKLQPAAELKHERIFSAGTWIAIFLGAAALVTTFLLIDMPFIDHMFSSTGIRKMSMNIFTNQFYESFTGLLTFMKQNLIGFIIFLAFLSLVVVERIISRRRPVQTLMIF
jgi:hypothetical protein